MYDVQVYFNLRNSLEKTPRTWEELWARTTSYKIKRVIFHPMYEHMSLDYDIAVMEVDGTVANGNTPIKLPSPTSESK